MQVEKCVIFTIKYSNHLDYIKIIYSAKGMRK